MFFQRYGARCWRYFFFFFFNDTATTEIYTLSLHDALPIYRWSSPAPSAAAGPMCRRWRELDHRYSICRSSLPPLPLPGGFGHTRSILVEHGRGERIGLITSMSPTWRVVLDQSGRIVMHP